MLRHLSHLTDPNGYEKDAQFHHYTIELTSAAKPEVQIKIHPISVAYSRPDQWRATASNHPGNGFFNEGNDAISFLGIHDGSKAKDDFKYEGRSFVPDASIEEKVGPSPQMHLEYVSNGLKMSLQDTTRIWSVVGQLNKKLLEQMSTDRAATQALHAETARRTEAEQAQTARQALEIKADSLNSLAELPV